MTGDFLGAETFVQRPFQWSSRSTWWCLGLNMQVAMCRKAITVPLEKVAIFREGKDLTVLAYGTMVWVSEAAANESGVDAEIIDLRSLWPLDLETIVASVRKPAAA